MKMPSGQLVSGPRFEPETLRIRLRSAGYYTETFTSSACKNFNELSGSVWIPDCTGSATHLFPEKIDSSVNLHVSYVKIRLTPAHKYYSLSRRHHVICLR